MRIGVIGGGASGMMAAIVAARAGGKVTVIEHTARVGKKILSTGNGKCNFTNQSLSKDDYNGNHPSFAEPVLRKFDQEAAVRFFAECGMLSLSKRDGYFYPYTGQAATVLNTLRFQLDACGVRVVTDAYIDYAEKENDGCFYVSAGGKKYVFDKLILACGGNAAPGTGSDGSGYKLAKKFGHKIIKPLPVLTYLKSKEVCLKELAGVRANVEVSLVIDGKKVQNEEGELQLNKDNVSGIPVFQLSHKAIKALDQKRTVHVDIDFLPQTGADALQGLLEDKLLLMYPEFAVVDILSMLVHKKISGAILRRAGISFEKKMQDLSRKEMNRIVGMTKEFSIAISGYPGFEAAQATMGGVDTQELDVNMQSKKVEGLYFVGELVDIDGRCGGYNLQWAWSSGYVAGSHCVNGEVTCYESISVK